MASKVAVVEALNIFVEVFPTREVTKTTYRVWEEILAPLTDEQVQMATARLVREPGRKFFPTTNDVFGVLADLHEKLPVADVVDAIARLGSYTARHGWFPPTVEQVRAALGDGVASAYAVVGGARLWANAAADGTTITRDIARREFGKALEDEQSARPTVPLLTACALDACRALPPGTDPERKLLPGPAKISDVVGNLGGLPQ